MIKYLIIFLLIPAVSFTQTNEIKFINHPYYKGDPLEKQTAKLSVKVRGLGYGGADSYLEVRGSAAKLNIPDNDSVRFEINIDKDIIGNLSLYKAEVVNNRRRVHYYKQRTFSGSDIGGEPISYNISEVGDGIYRITPGQPLDDGEYIFVLQGMASGMGDAFSFSVGDVPVADKQEKGSKKRGFDDVYGR